MSTMTNPYAPPKAAVRDIFTSDSPIVYADRGTRLGAAILDTIIFMVMVYLPLMVGAVVGGVMAGLSEAGGGEPGAAMPLAFLIAFAVGAIGFAAWAWLTIKYVRENGQSIAKRWLKIKVVRTDGSPISLGRIFWMRNVVNGLLGIIPLYGLIEVLFIFGESQQCLHDKIADTIVIKA